MTRRLSMSILQESKSAPFSRMAGRIPMVVESEVTRGGREGVDEWREVTLGEREGVDGYWEVTRGGREGVDGWREDTRGWREGVDGWREDQSITRWVFQV
jgi:hypothetical protein